MMHRFLPFLLVVTIVSSAVGHGQEPFPSPASPVEGAPRSIGGIRDEPSTPVFRSRVEAVALDVFVTDAEGHPVSGLTPSPSSRAGSRT